MRIERIGGGIEALVDGREKRDADIMPAVGHGPAHGLNEAHLTRIDDAGALQRIELDTAKLPPHEARNPEAAISEVETVNILNVDAERHLLGIFARQFRPGRRRGLRGPAYQQQDKNGDDVQQGGHAPARTQTQYRIHPYAPLSP